MNPKRLQQRWHEIDAELEDIRNGKVTIGSDPATREGELLEELDRWVKRTTIELEIRSGAYGDRRILFQITGG